MGRTATNDILDNPANYASGEIAGAASATAFPTLPCRAVIFKAKSDNSGTVYIGVAGVTVADNSADATTGLELSAKESTPWLPCVNLNQFYHIGSDANQRLTYLAIL